MPVRVVVAAGLGLTAVDAWLAGRYGAYGFLFDLKEIGQVLTWLVAGYLAARIRPGSRMGLLMTILGTLLASTAPAAFALETGSGAVNGVVAVAFVLTAFQLPLGAHVFLAYPSGVVHDRLGRGVAVAGWVFGGVTALAQALAGPIRPEGRCRDVCAPMPLVDHPGLAAATAQLSGLGSAVLTLVGASVIVHRLVRASRRQRRVLAFPGVAMVATAVLFAVVGLLAAASPDGVDQALAPAQFASLVAVPLAFFLGLLRARLDEARVSDLVRHIRFVRADRLREALSTALDDPGLRIGFPTPGGCVDAAGEAVDLPDDPARRTVVGDADDPLAVIVHDAGLRTEPALLESAGAAVRLALENARLQEAMWRQLEEVRASRARLVTAGDDARRRLERDLHDGAQQRLLSVGLILNLVRQSLSPDGTRPETVALLDEVEAELRLATRELRELARGIHPAVLTMQGLRAAVEQLLVRVPLRSDVRIGELPRLRQAVEATAYFVVSEAVANAVRHARAARIGVEVHVEVGGCLVVRIADDGVGGATPAPGSGLSGLTDRVAAVGGRLTLHSPAGHGTTLTAELPCG
ncbi:ATP-binding protein [Actinosynnema sp. NPDC004786]